MRLRPERLGAALAAVAMALALSGRAAAAGWYLRAAVGRASAGVNTAELTGALDAAGLPATAQVHGADAAWTVVGGLQLQRHWALEGGYIDLGRARTTVDAVGIRDPAALLRTIADDGPILPHGWTAQAVGRISPLPRLHAFARIGLLRWESDVSVAAAPLASLQRTVSGVAFTYGAGVEYRLLERISVGVSLQRYDLRGGAVDFAALGFRYDFHGPWANDPDRIPVP